MERLGILMDAPRRFTRSNRIFMQQVASVANELEEGMNWSWLLGSTATLSRVLCKGLLLGAVGALSIKYGYLQLLTAQALVPAPQIPHASGKHAAPTQWVHLPKPTKRSLRRAPEYICCSVPGFAEQTLLPCRIPDVGTGSFQA